MGVIEFYNDFYTKAELSRAHGTFCEKVYGKNLCQHGMADMTQIEELLRLLNLNEKSRLLDLGCGSGFLTEYIQKSTNSYVTGIDISPIAIEIAIKRTTRKSNKLKFEVGDMSNLQCNPNSFDAVILVDTHYFIDDFEALLEKLLYILVPGGHVGLFSDEGRGVLGCDDSNLKASESLIGKLLNKKGIYYKALDFHKENREHWRYKENVLRELISEFEKEDNMFLYENRINECTSTNRELDGRFLFLITKK
jgi:SAM-dependent methyltransferase